MTTDDKGEGGIDCTDDVIKTVILALSMMVVLRDHLNGETAEWVDTEEIDTDHLENESSNSKQGATAVRVIDNIEQWTNTTCQDI